LESKIKEISYVYLIIRKLISYFFLLNNIGIYGLKTLAKKLYTNLTLQNNNFSNINKNENSELNKSDNLVSIINKRVD